MSSTISAGTTAGTAIAISGDTSGQLVLQTNGTTTAVTISTGQVVTLAQPLPVASGGSGVTTSTGTGANVLGTSPTLATPELSAGTALLPALTTTGDTNTGLWFPAADTIAASTGGTERLRINSSGNVLVNTTSGSGAAVFTVAADTTTANPMAISNTRTTAATDYSLLFYRAASLVGSVQTTLTATSYVTSSDYRLKQHILPMTGALAKVAHLKPVTYKWKLDGTDGQGFIAHELQAIVPDCVTGEKDAVDAGGKPKYQGIDTSFLVATLTAAIQELKAIIDTQAAQITALNAKVGI